MDQLAEALGRHLRFERPDAMETVERVDDRLHVLDVSVEEGFERPQVLGPGRSLREVLNLLEQLGELEGQRLRAAARS